MQNYNRNNQILNQMSNHKELLEYSESTFPSQVFPDHFYEIIGGLGQGGLGTVYSALLRCKKTLRATHIYAAKVIYEATIK